jgi:predicted transposase YdaD
VTTQKFWDSLTKRLVQTNPQDLISWISPNTVYESELNTELQKDPIRADLMYIVRRKGRKVVFHIEIQKQHDKNMGRRVWEYNVSTTLYTGLPVYSVVLYLVKDSSIVEPPYTIDLSDDEIVHHFVFQNIKLWEIAPETLLEQNLPCLLPLLPLTEEGNRREVVQQMFHRLQQADKKDLLAIGYRITVLMLKEIDQQWLKEMFMSVENIFEGTWMYDEIHQKGVKQGLEQGVKQGLEQGLQAQRTLLLSFVKTHFPNELALANQQVGLIMTLPQAQELLDNLFVTRTDDEVKAILLSIPHA